MEPNKKKIHFFLFFIIATFASVILGKELAKGNFIELFIGEKYNVSVQATEYIHACCVSDNDVIKLLHDNGFNVIVNAEPEQVAKLNKYYRQSTHDTYDEFISAYRGPVFWRFWDFFASYEVSLFLKKGKVVRVDAYVRRTML